MKTVNFNSQGKNIVGHFYLPENAEHSVKFPAVIVTGAWTTVKEQMPDTYAKKLTQYGYAALTFDFRGWGESQNEIQYLENPERKIEDIEAAADFLSTVKEIDSARIAGLGICASSGYLARAALNNRHIKSIALVAPWLHDASIVQEVYGGEQGVNQLMKISQEAEQSKEPHIIEAASNTNQDSLMYQAPYYTEKDRGLIQEYDNKFNLASWEGWLTFDAIKTADSLQKPTLLVHSEAAAIPQGTKAFAKKMGETAEMVWLDDVTQFDFYDQSKPVTDALNAVDKHFKKTL